MSITIIVDVDAKPFGLDFLRPQSNQEGAMQHSLEQVPGERALSVTGITTVIESLDFDNHCARFATGDCVSFARLRVIKHMGQDTWARSST